MSKKGGVIEKIRERQRKISSRSLEGIASQR